MLRVLVISAIAMVSLATPILDITLDEAWEMWKDQQNKMYSGKHEELKRRTTWEDNYNKINLHNLEHSLGQNTYTMEMNAFGDLTHKEFVKRNGFKKSTKKTMKLGHKFEHKTDNNVADVPDSKDWRDDGYVTPVKNQGQCGSCWSFSATGSLEGQYFREYNILKSFSEQQLVDCSTPEGDYGCNGGLMDDAFKYIEQHKIETETDYPYTAEDGTCVADATKGVTEVTGYTDVQSGSEDDLKTACGENGPVSVAIDASHESFQFYNSGVYSEPDCSTTQLDHGVLVVGYGTDEETGSDYWLVKNSWGEEWGLQGYIKMSRNQQNQCGIATSASYPIVQPSN